MQLERITAEMRPRRPWESVDLGFSMVRAWWRPLFAAWLSVVLPVALAVNLLLVDRPWLAVLIVWWLKPLFDRIPLHVLSRALFGATPRYRDTLKAVPGLLWPQAIRALTLHRFSPVRSFTLPVRQLEGMKGAARRARVRVLEREAHDTALKLTLACLHFEAVVFCALLGLVYLMLPRSVEAEFWTLLLEQPSGWGTALRNGLAVAALVLVEPFYVAAGFALYLNRRTQLEGWDIELAFRRLAGRLALPQSAAAVLAGAVLLGGLAGSPGTAWAAAEPLAAEQAKRLIDEVLDGPEFNTREEVVRWRPIEREAKASPEPQGDGQWLRSILELGGALARVIELLLWLLLIAALVGVAVYARRWLPLIRARGYRRRELRPPEVLFGLDLRPESLPDDVAAAAWRAWQQGAHAEAIGLLYRGALATLVERDGVRLPRSATEGDCLRAVQAAQAADRPQTVAYFRLLTGAWQGLAYARRVPGSDQAHALCRAWATHFGAAR